MSQIIFPPDPEIGQEFTEGEKVWRWNGFRWRAIPSSLIAVQNEIDGITNDLTDKADLVSPEFTGVPIAPTAAAQTDTTQIATTAFVQGELSSLALSDTNIIEEVQAEGVALAITSKAVNVTRASLGAGTGDANVFFFSATIAAVDWTGTEAPYTAVIDDITGILDTDRPIVDLDLSNVAIGNVEAKQADWGLVYRAAVTATDTITFFATDEPTEDLVIQIKVVR